MVDKFCRRTACGYDERMGLPLTNKRRFTPAEYYSLEHEATYKSDFYDGEIYDMSGGTGDHSLIVANTTGSLWALLRHKPCKVYESNMRVAIRATGLRTYPDVSIYCNPLEYDFEDPKKTTAINPTVLFEVLSPSTERYDRGVKADHYRRIESLIAHAIVWQDEPKIELFERDGGAWTSRSVNGLAGSIMIPGPGVALALADVYEGVEFPAP
jgi:Uma2 family endonuclease